MTECLNTAIEAAIDLGTSDPHPLAKIGKDVASTAALVSAIVFVVIVILILVHALDRPPRGVAGQSGPEQTLLVKSSLEFISIKS